jgi:hypothetical protein
MSYDFLNSNILAKPIAYDMPATASNMRVGTMDPMQIGSQDAMGVGSGTGLPDSLANWGAKPGGFDWGNAMNTFNTGAQGLLGLAGAYNAYKQMGLMEDQFNFQKNLANTNLANQAAITNQKLSDKAYMAAQMTGGTPGTPEFEAKKKELTTQVSGAPAG